jgi:DNA helicase-2/ATP-dependent DNA helicase PcrA
VQKLLFERNPYLVREILNGRNKTSKGSGTMSPRQKSGFQEGIKINTYQQNFQEERSYLEKTVSLIQRELTADAEILAQRKEKVIELRREMWDNAAHFSHDFTRLAELSQYQSEVDSQTANYLLTAKRVNKYKKMISSPYFGRFDFLEAGSQQRERIYLGLANVIDPHTQIIHVYDWRAPICSIFYRYELGKAAYQAPMGEIRGEVLLKRQFKIKDSKLKYFFDCSIRITDEMLQEILSRNASPQMRNIVETIQKEQDLIIRDTANDLLIVQGVAGSGKTSIALHRVAFLLYEGLSAKIGSHNILIISLNDIFSIYISNVLPELGEENVAQLTFDDLGAKLLKDRFVLESRTRQLETLIQHQDPVRKKSIEFKGSRTFIQILERLIWYWGHKLIPFTDLYFDGELVETRQQLKNRFLNNKLCIPMGTQLQKIESRILEQIHPLQKRSLEKIRKIVIRHNEHQLEVEPYSRLLSFKRTQRFIEELRKFTRVDYWDLYQLLFQDSKLFFKLASGLKLPQEIDEIISTTQQDLTRRNLKFEDLAPVLYLLLKIEGHDLFSQIRHVVIDEAQDYYPLQYEVFKFLFPSAKYTVLGDVNQALEKNEELSLYDEITQILDPPQTLKLFLNKGYRASYEINRFTQKLLAPKQQLIPFERHGQEPQVIGKKDHQQLLEAIISDLNYYNESGYGSIAVICKTQAQAQQVASELETTLQVQLIKPNGDTGKQGIVVIPSYLAKGLEFDVVIVYQANEDHYSTELDRRLLYVACTRALHQLKVYYSGKVSPFLINKKAAPEDDKS